RRRPAMRRLILAFALPISALTLAAAEPAGKEPAPGAEKKPTAPPRELSKADVERSRALFAKAVALGRAGKYAEAQAPIREILELRTRVLGKDHFETGDARREIETLKKLAALPEEGRIEYMKTYVLSDQISDLWKKGRYADALGPAEQLVDIYRR